MWVYADGVVRQIELDPQDLGIPRAALAELVGGDPRFNAQVVRDTVDGRPGPIRDVVLLNAAAALVAYAKPPADGLLDAFAEHLARAREAVDSGAAQRQAERTGSRRPRPPSEAQRIVSVFSDPGPDAQLGDRRRSAPPRPR